MLLSLSNIDPLNVCFTHGYLANRFSCREICNTDVEHWKIPGQFFVPVHVTHTKYIPGV
jgi:hypothetical protein